MKVMNVSVAEAKNRLTELIKKVEDGEDVVIERRGKPVVQIVKAKPKGQRRLGFLSGSTRELCQHLSSTKIPSIA